MLLYEVYVIAQMEWDGCSPYVVWSLAKSIMKGNKKSSSFGKIDCIPDFVKHRFFGEDYRRRLCSVCTVLSSESDLVMIVVVV